MPYNYCPESFTNTAKKIKHDTKQFRKALGVDSDKPPQELTDTQLQDAGIALGFLSVSLAEAKLETHVMMREIDAEKSRRAAKTK